jgi:hypothetical protein
MSPIDEDIHLNTHADPHADPHADEGAIATLRDEGMVDPWLSSHLDECAVCIAELVDAKGRSAAVAEALATLDIPVNVTAAKTAVRRRLDRERPEVSRSARRIPIGRAAAILLITAGAAAALPWSPLARWWSEPAVPAPAAATQSAAPGDPTAASVAVVVVDAIEVVVTGAAAGAAVDVTWLDEGSARVAAPSGSEFTFSSGRIEVQATAGALRLELPRAARASVVVNGRDYLERSAAGISVIEPAAEVTDERVRFVVPQD